MNTIFQARKIKKNTSVEKMKENDDKVFPPTG